MPSKYISRPESDQFVVAPIFYGNLSIGYICGDEFEEDFTKSNDLLEAFTTFSKMTGELFATYYSNPDRCPLSRRELEVMHRVSLGESTKKIVHYIKISDLTVNQYIKSAIKKLNAKNRVEAITKLCKLGLI